MSQSLAKLFATLDDAEMAGFAAMYQMIADRRQKEARQAQREADAARKELKRRKLE
jgi:hypothetical protein